MSFQVLGTIYWCGKHTTYCVPPIVNVSIVSHKSRPAYDYSIISTKTMTLIGLHYAVVYVMIAATALAPVLEVIKFWGKAVGPSTPAIVSIATAKRKQSAHC